ncbi:unnamed protein product [Phaedon cochleariae]|uniref:Major facilitator superfamily (MFS) profile domain-containing protein n=1 Tax=Phaedon cochleariae TaxID=80249 RepID=A0A9P0GX90_PHACE|nr:unnamed protein product [Phaedon cochleariae]
MDMDVPPMKFKVTKVEDDPKIIRQSISGDADFETAISAAGFGKFNFLLCLCLIPSAWSQLFEAQTLAFVLPIAECDLDLTLEQKGILNSACFAGMILSSFIWGYLSDILGRKRVMVYGYLMDWCCMIMASFSQSFAIMLTAKFLGGFIINGPFSAVASLLSEFHSSKYRSRVQLVRGIIVALGSVTIPLLAWAILPRNWNFSISGYVAIHSWNIYLLVCSFSSLTSGLIFIFMPESPKFLMSKGRNEEALDVFRRVYSMNYGKPKDQYPIKSLVNECCLPDSTASFRRQSVHIIRGFIGTVKPLFTRQYIFYLILTCVNGFMLLMSTNTLKLWLPQLLQAVNDYQQSYGGSSDICNMLETLVPANETKTTCEVNLNNSSVYINSTLIGFAQVAVFGLVAIFLGKISEKITFGILAVISAIASVSIYAGQNIPTLMALFAVSLSASGVCANISMTLTLELFPTSIRTSALSLNLMCARLGSVIGSSVFPWLLNSGCLPPFLFIGLLTFGAGLTLILYPNTKGKTLK